MAKTVHQLLNAKYPDGECVILQKKNNLYFNYMMFIEGESNLKSIILISHE